MPSFLSPLPSGDDLAFVIPLFWRKFTCKKGERGKEKRKSPQKAPQSELGRSETMKKPAAPE
jgi:hypothetical protein